MCWWTIILVCDPEGARFISLSLFKGSPDAL
jgi:hypothetical protein